VVAGRSANRNSAGLALAALPDLYTGTINPLYIARYDASRVNRYLNEQSRREIWW